MTLINREPVTLPTGWVGGEPVTLPTGWAGGEPTPWAIAMDKLRKEHPEFLQPLTTKIY